MKNAASRVTTATPLELGEHAERRERGARVRQHVDADAERLHLGRRLVDAAGDAGAVQRERERQAADAGADDGDVAVAAALRKAAPSLGCGALSRAAKISPQRDMLVHARRVVEHLRRG